MSKTTNKAQYERLYELMTEKQDVAQGFSKLPKEDANVFWETVKDELNSLGPPSKDASVWRKVWLDWKAYIKRKLVENKKDVKATGGGEYRQHSFSKLEEGVIKLTGLHTSTSGISKTFSFGCGTSAQVERVAEEAVQNDSSIDEGNLDVSMSSQRRAHSSQPRNVEDTTANLLRQQLALQKQFYKDEKKHMEDLVFNTKRIYRGIDKCNELIKMQIEEEQRRNKVREELLQKKIEIKMRMLRIEESKHNLDSSNSLD